MQNGENGLDLAVVVIVVVVGLGGHPRPTAGATSPPPCSPDTHASIKSFHSLRQPTTHALVSLVNRLLRLDLMEPVFERCPTNNRLRRTLAECLAGNRDASVLLRRHPMVAVRATGAAVRKIVNRS